MVTQAAGERSLMKTVYIIAVLISVCACGRGERPASVVESKVTSEPAIEDKVPDIEACVLLDRGDVIRIFGALRDEAKPDRGLRGEKDCRWRNEQGQWLKTSLYGAGRWDLEKAIVSEMHPKPLANAGDEAFSVKQGTDSVVHVRKGGAVIEVSCSCGIEKSESLARMAAAKL
jgi:hypothetical protein